MNQTLDLIAVLALVAVAIAYLVRRHWRSRRRSARGVSCSACGRCGNGDA
jgi:flagellar biogenesis protein FliO